MPTANPFTALGKGNGFPFCVQRSTDSVLTAFDGHEDTFTNPITGAVTIVEKYRVKEVTLAEAMNFIWNLYSVTFSNAGIVDGSGNPLTFTNPGILRYGQESGYINADVYTPRERVNNKELSFSIPRTTTDPGFGFGWFVAQTGSYVPDDSDPGNFVADDSSAQFAIRAIYLATDTEKYYMIFTRSVRADDDSFVQEIPFANLTFNYYTYS